MDAIYVKRQREVVLMQQVMKVIDERLKEEHEEICALERENTMFRHIFGTVEQTQCIYCGSFVFQKTRCALCEKKRSLLQLHNLVQPQPIKQ